MPSPNSPQGSFDTVTSIRFTTSQAADNAVSDRQCQCVMRRPAMLRVNAMVMASSPRQNEIKIANPAHSAPGLDQSDPCRWMASDALKPQGRAASIHSMALSQGGAVLFTGCTSAQSCAIKVS